MAEQVDRQDKKKISLELFGHDYSFHTDTPPEKVKAIVGHFQSRLKEVLAATNGVSHHKAVILAALNISEDYFALKQEFSEFKEKLKARSEKALALVDETLGYDPKQASKQIESVESTLISKESVNIQNDSVAQE